VNGHSDAPAHDPREALRKAISDHAIDISFRDVDLILAQLWIEGYMVVPVPADLMIECTH
jgi:hypothetical protein